MANSATIKNADVYLNNPSPSGKVWLSNGFFGDQRNDLTFSKENFAENTLLYANQGIVTIVKAGE